MSRILVVEDDARLAALLAELLTGAGHEVALEGRGDRAIERILAEQPDLVLLDVGLPGADGLAVCRTVRPRYPGRILMLTARADEIDEVVGLELGADDYLAKPPAPRRLLARVGALLRRAAPAPSPVLRNGPLELDPTRRVARLEGRTLELGTAEFELLMLLMQRVGAVLSRDDLAQALKGCAYDGLDRSIDLRISRLRRALGDAPRRPRWIKTVHGTGYLLVPAG